MSKERVHKIIAASGLMSRRKAEEAILAGRVKLNGEVLTTLGSTADLSVDTILVDEQKIELKTEKRTFLFHKPREVVTTKVDPEGRPTVMDFFRDCPSVNPVGRLDYDSEGLLLMTEDGDLLLTLTHPRYGVKKVYDVEVEGVQNANFMKTMLQGVELTDGLGKFDEIEELRPKREYRITVSEGRNRFVRRMFGALGLSVTRLKRISMGEYQLGNLKPGERLEWKS